MTPEEAYNIKVISDIKLTNLGLLHVETWIEKDEYKTAIFLNKKRVTWGGNEALPNIINNNFYYVKNEKEKSLLIKQEMFGEPVSLLSLNKIKKYVFHQKGILILGEENFDKNAPFVAEKLKYRFDGRGLLRARQSLFLFNEKLEKVVSGNFDVIDVATNGKRVAIAATKENDDIGLADIYELDVATGELTKITKGENTITAIDMNENGEIAFIGHNKGKTPWAIKKVILPEKNLEYLCGNNTGSTVLTDLFDGYQDKLIFKKDEIITLGQEGGATNLFKIIDNRVEKITNGKHVIRGFDYNDTNLAYYYSTQTKPSLLYYKEETYDPNPNVEGIQPIELNENIQGWLILINENNPLIVAIHGGPHTAYGYGYFIEFQFYARNGFNILYSNPTGSQGYGEDFAKGCVGDWGGKDMNEIIELTNIVKEKYNLKGKIGVTGGSYGGFMTNWIVTQTNIFSAAISERSISNLVSMCGTSDIGFWFNAVEAGIEDPWLQDSIQKLIKMSPIFYVKNVKTPTMLIHGEEDYRCPIEQAEQFFNALKMNGVPTVLVRYQGDGHEHARKGKPLNMKDRLKRKLEWFNNYLK
jgi:Dipeptidyl aminopeptidases/acylaminoacyl-peptidases